MTPQGGYDVLTAKGVRVVQLVYFGPIKGRVLKS